MTTVEGREVEGLDPGPHLGKLEGGDPLPDSDESGNALGDPPLNAAVGNDAPPLGAADAPPLPIAGLVHGLPPPRRHLNGVEWSVVHRQTEEGGLPPANPELEPSLPSFRRHRS